MFKMLQIIKILQDAAGEMSIILAILLNHFKQTLVIPYITGKLRIRTI